MRHHLVVPFIVFASLLLAGELLFGASESRTRPAPPASAVDGLEPVFGPVMKLFNGTDLAGWNAYFGDGSRDAAKAWSVRDGILVCNGGPVGYLQTDLRFESFELVVEWRFDPELGAGNSGVLLRMTGEDTVWPRSIEAQLHSRNAGDIWNIGAFPMIADPARTKGRRTVKAHDTNEKPLGEWNRYRIRLDRDRLTLEVNGLVQNEATGCQTVPGRIGLQSEGAAIEFRRVELRPIVAWNAASD
ncbi:MAG: DUF1080 domain-containing protein [Phycisphaeraceae bacterium]|nr:DUF1080 domain-containing protein [Phycisphaeraceae bacterium]